MSSEDPNSESDEGHEDEPEGFEMVALSDDESDLTERDEE